MKIWKYIAIILLVGVLSETAVAYFTIRNLRSKLISTESDLTEQRGVNLQRSSIIESIEKGLADERSINNELRGQIEQLERINEDRDRELELYFEQEGHYNIESYERFEQLQDIFRELGVRLSEGKEEKPD